MCRPLRDHPAIRYGGGGAENPCCCTTPVKVQSACPGDDTCECPATCKHCPDPVCMCNCGVCTKDPWTCKCPCDECEAGRQALHGPGPDDD